MNMRSLMHWEGLHGIKYDGMYSGECAVSGQRGRAVVALTPTGESVVIIGYDIYNTILYNPATQETYYYGMNDSTSLFESAGNVFLGYMETLEARTGK